MPDARSEPRLSSAEQHLALVIELPCMHTADIDGFREFAAPDETESDFLLNVIGEPSIVRIRMEISGEKDSQVMEVWGHVREARLVVPDRGYGDGPKLTDKQLSEHGGSKLTRDEGACEWCQFYEPEASPDA